MASIHEWPTPHPPWSQLPTELLELVARKLAGDISNFIRFRCICRSWRHTGKPSDLSSENPPISPVPIMSGLLITLCTVVTVCTVVWLGEYKNELDYSPYFRKRNFVGDDKNYNHYEIALEAVFAFLKSVIVISLYISMELVRLGQAYFMLRDRHLYDKASNLRFQCQALNINEDLGQIKYVYSNKTGTLTENKMEFQCASIRGLDYSGDKSPEPVDVGGVVN